jgi:hypothetical protein
VQTDKSLIGKVSVSDLVAQGLSYRQSLSGHERDRLFISDGGKSFEDISGISGLDDEADGRSYAISDFNRDGWLDFVVINANNPRLRIMENRIPRLADVRNEARMVAVRLFGANKTAAANPESSNRDAIGAIVSAEIEGAVLKRELRAGEGFAAQNSNMMVIGVGASSTVKKLSIRWPSGKEQSIENVKTGVLLTAYENPEDSPSRTGFEVLPYHVAYSAPAPPARTPISKMSLAQTSSQDSKAARLFLTLSPECAGCRSEVTQLEAIRKAIPDLRLSIVEVDEPGITTASTRQPFPPQESLYDVVARESADNTEVNRVIRETLGSDQVPAGVLADSEGNVLNVLPTVPSISELRKALNR